MKTYKAKSFWVKGKRKGYFKSEVLEQPSKNEVVIKTIYTGISMGTEKLVFDGNIPLSQRKLMRCPFQVGDFNDDVKYGYINVGKVVDGPKSLLKKSVFSLFPHQDIFKLSINDLTMIPKNIPLKRSLLIPNLETAINAIWDTLPTPGDRIIVLGAGVVGLLTANILNKIPGINLIIVDSNNKKEDVCKKLGLSFEKSIPRSFEADIIYECTGNSSVLNSLKKNICYDSLICILSWYGDKKSSLNLGEEFFSKRAKIILSQVSKISPNRSHMNHSSRRQLAMNLLRDSKLDNLIEKSEIMFTKLGKFLNDKKNSKNILCKVVKY